MPWGTKRRRELVLYVLYGSALAIVLVVLFVKVGT
jgi:hypothetical protein